MLNSSSSKYECEFASLMSEYVDRITIISPNAPKDESKTNISLIAIPNSNLIKNITPVIVKLSEIFVPENETVVLFFGYNPLLILSLTRWKKKNIDKGNRIGLSSIVYDTHLGELDGKRFFRKTMICCFYSLGLVLINKVDKVLLFKEKAAKRMRLKRKYFVILPTIDCDSIIKPFQVNPDSKIIFMYAGTLCEYNGIKQIVDCFRTIEYQNIELRIFGDGSLRYLVEEAAKEDERIHYYGRVSSTQIDLEMEQADILLNVRRVPSAVNDYAFPFKIVEYMNAGKGIVSTKVSDSDDFDNAVFLLQSADTEQLTQMIWHICNNRLEISQKVSFAKSYLEKHHNRETISKQAYDFLFQQKEDTTKNGSG